MSDNATLVERLSSTTHVGFELDDLCEEAGTRIAELEAEVAWLTKDREDWVRIAHDVTAERDKLLADVDGLTVDRDAAEAERDRLREALEIIRAGETLDPRRAADAALEETP